MNATAGCTTSFSTATKPTSAGEIPWPVRGLNRSEIPQASSMTGTAIPATSPSGWATSRGMSICHTARVRSIRDPMVSGFIHTAILLVPVEAVLRSSADPSGS